MSIFESAINAALPALLAITGKSFSYTPSGGASTTITAILEEGDDFETENPGSKFGLSVKLADLSFSPTDGDLVVINGDDYRVIEIVPADVTGLALLLVQLLRS